MLFDINDVITVRV